MKDYIEIGLQLKSNQESEQEIIMALLADAGYEGFQSEAGRLSAYIPSADFVEAALDSLLEPFQDLIQSRELQRIPYRNWNEDWESSYEAVDILETCHVRASFHPEPVDRTYDLLISPKMSFGTAHHETTRLMIEQMLQIRWEGRSVLDLGCGTGILAILASKMGAKKILAVDNDPLASGNATENVSLNRTRNIDVLEAECSSIARDPFDVILANINLNVLLAEMECMSSMLESHGILLLSGFYRSDLPTLDRSAASHGLVQKDVNTLNRWTVAVYVKGD